MRLLKPSTPVVGRWAALFVIGAVAFAGAAQSSEPPPREMQLYTVDAEGRRPTLVTRDPRAIRDLQWSPDGGRLLLGRSDGELWQWNFATASEQQLTHVPEFDGRGVYAPDGRHVAFDSERGGNFDIYLLRLADGSVRRLTSDPAFDTVPVWSPDGRKIAFHSRRGGFSTLFVMNADGSGARALSGRRVSDDPVSWSPDGRRLVFCRVEAGSSDLYRVNADGSGEIQLTRGLGAISPSWHRNGRILFAGGHADKNTGWPSLRIYTITPDGSDLRVLGPPEIDDIRPVWSPDGRWIAYSSVGEVWKMRANGSGQVRLTHGLRPFIPVQPGDVGRLPMGRRRSPRWAPDGKRLLILHESWEDINPVGAS